MEPYTLNRILTVIKTFIFNNHLARFPSRMHLLLLLYLSKPKSLFKYLNIQCNSGPSLKHPLCVKLNTRYKHLGYVSMEKYGQRSLFLSSKRRWKTRKGKEISTE